MTSRGKRPAEAPFVYIGAGNYGQHKVSDAPGYKKGAKGPLRSGILITRALTKEGALEEVGFYNGPEFGYLAYNAKIAIFMVLRGRKDGKSNWFGFLDHLSPPGAPISQ